jgi:hypothetical protein
MLTGDSCHMRHLKGGGPVSPKPRQSPTFFANFRELRYGEVRGTPQSASRDSGRRGTMTPPINQAEEAKRRGFLEEAPAHPGG